MDLFTQWIKDAPKEKWSILYDTGGRRYEIETTNHAECYNMVMRHVRGFPLVGIVEFIMYGCTRYFRERYQTAAVLLNDPGVVFCNRVTKYMKKKIEKAQYHRVVSMGIKDRKFDALWQVLDNMCAKLLKEQASTPSRRRSGGRPFHTVD